MSMCFECNKSQAEAKVCDTCSEWICVSCRAGHPSDKGCFPKKDRAWIWAMREFGYEPSMVHLSPEAHLDAFGRWFHERLKQMEAT